MFWSVVNRIAGKKKETNIPPLLEDGVFINSFPDKANIFNEFFASQCNPLENDSSLPLFQVLSPNELSTIVIDTSQISSLIGHLNSKKPHGHDNILINMLKLTRNEVAVPLRMIFERYLTSGEYPSAWKNANLKPVHKK